MKVIHELSLKSIIKKEPGEAQGMRRWYISHLGFSIYKNVEASVNRNIGRISSSSIGKVCMGRR